MTTIERDRLIVAVLASRDQVDPDFDSELLKDIVNAEAEAAGDSEAAMRAISAAVTAAIERGVGQLDAADAEVDGPDQDDEDKPGC